MKYNTAWYCYYNCKLYVNSSMYIMEYGEHTVQIVLNDNDKHMSNNDVTSTV